MYGKGCIIKNIICSNPSKQKWLKVCKPSFKYQFTSPKILVKTEMNRQGLV